MKTIENECRVFMNDPEGCEVESSYSIPDPASIRFSELETVMQHNPVHLCDGQIRLCVARPKSSPYVDNKPLYNYCLRYLSLKKPLRTYEEYQWKRTTLWPVFICADWKYLEKLNTNVYFSCPEPRVLTLKNGLKILDAGKWDGKQYKTPTKEEADKIAKTLGELMESFCEFFPTIKNELLNE